jgi:hypothetical protein
MRFDQEVIMCEVCGNEVAVIQHEKVYGTGRRKICLKYDCCCVLICARCHQAAHGLIDIGYDINKKLRVEAQQEFEEKYSHELWMKEFGVNYL